MTLHRLALSALLLIPIIARAQTAATKPASSPVTVPYTLPAGSPLPVQIDTPLPMRVGVQVRAHLIYPVYANDTLVLPEHTVVTGTVTALRSNRSRRIRARLRLLYTSPSPRD